MRSVAIICFVLAVLSGLVALRNVFGSDRDIEDLVGYAVGSFLLPIGFLIGGLVLWRKSNKA